MDINNCAKKYFKLPYVSRLLPLHQWIKSNCNLWDRINCVVTSVCVFRFVYTLLLKRNSEVKKTSSDSESNSFAKFWSSSDEDIMEDDVDDVEESSNTQNDVTRCVT